MAQSESLSPFIELFPYGVAAVSAQSRPVLILKDSKQTEVLPVWLSPLDAGMVISDRSQILPSPHAVTQKLLRAMDVEVDRCEFADVVGHHQYVDIYLRGGVLDKLRVRADEAMSFCLTMGARFFARQDYMVRCRDVDAEMASIEQGLNLNPKIVAKNHRYMM